MAQAMSMLLDTAPDRPAAMITQPSSTTPPAYSSGLPVTMDRAMAPTLPSPSPLTARAMSMLLDSAPDRPAAMITQPSSTTPPAYSSGLPVTMDRGILMTTPMPLPLTAQAMSTLREAAVAQGSDAVAPAMTTQPSSTTLPAYSSGSLVTMDRGFLVTSAVPSPLTPQAMSMSPGKAWDRAAVMIMPQSSTTLRARNSGSIATTGRGTGMTMPVLSPLTGQAMCM